MDTSPTVVPYFPHREIVKRWENILQLFVSFYRTLYSPIASYELLDTLGALQLPEESRDFLDAIFKEEEVVSAIE